MIYFLDVTLFWTYGVALSLSNICSQAKPLLVTVNQPVQRKGDTFPLFLLSISINQM